MKLSKRQKEVLLLLSVGATVIVGRKQHRLYDGLVMRGWAKDLGAAGNSELFGYCGTKAGNDALRACGTKEATDGR